MKKKLARLGALASGLALSAGVFAAPIDISAATAGITEAQTAVVGVVVAMTTMAIAVWGVRKVIKLFRG